MMSASAWYGMIFTALLTTTPVHAAFVSGDFSGTAIDSEQVSGVPEAGNFDGAPVTGSFGFDTAAVGMPAFGILTFDVPDIVSYDFSGVTALSIADDGLQQSIGLTANPLFQSGSLTIFGPSGSLFDALDLSSFDPQSFVFSDATATFGSRSGPTATVDISALSFDQPVSEPGSLALLGIGLAGMNMVGRKKWAGSGLDPARL